MRTKLLHVLLLLVICNIHILRAQQRIIGGQSIDISQAPYQVAIFTDYGFGGGVIINNQWILTAAHVSHKHGTHKSYF
ncbi:trypsin-like serine protease [uncultured Parabacteroides sp.]|uniref:trypsin-like serine protease n=1 Tax=uncultured Parabacteroides sp. TaxID=512312 RepID=UPI00261BD7AE|nr:trypsin-like serine protease [uncultured Parabacteroides sp.]